MSQSIDKIFKRQSGRIDFRTNSQDNLCDDVKRSFTSLKENIKRIFLESIARVDYEDFSCAEKEISDLIF